MKTSVMPLLACFAAAFAPVAGSAAPIEDVSIAGPAAGPWRRLFLDAMVVERQAGLERVFHAAEKHPGNPVLRADKPWEGTGRGTTVEGGTVMLDDGKLRMWYLGDSKGGYRYRLCYAESEDGVTWTKPPLGIVEVAGSKDNNVIHSGEDVADPDKRLVGYFTFVSVIKSPATTDPARRYALYGYYHCIEMTPEGGVAKFFSLNPRVAFSPDGLRWTLLPDETGKGLFPASDVNQFYRDPYKGRYYATWKGGNRRGRAAGVVFSPDGLKWTKPVEGPVFVADDLDPDDTQIYGLGAFAYQGLYVGLPWMYHARWFKYGKYADQRMNEVEKDSPCTMDAQLAWSWDLINWTRTPNRPPFIALGKEGEFDAGMAIPAKEPVQVGDRLYFYYAGFPGRHNEGGKQLAATGLATLRLDGFCSMRAGAAEGNLITRREPFRVPKVTINAKTAPDGYVLAELLDTENRVIPGFGRDDCVPFTGDAVRHVLTWKTTELSAAQHEPDKKIRFFLKNADLFSYLPEPTPAGKTEDAVTLAEQVHKPAVEQDLKPFLTRIHGRLESGQESVRIVCFGDSITGVFYHTGGRRAWCDMLGIALGRIYPKAKLEMINAGVNGNSTGPGLARMEKDVLAHKPHLVIVMYGMNDCAGGNPDPFGNNLRTMVQRSRAAGAEVVLCTPNSIYPEDPRRSPHLASFAEMVRKVAAEMSVPLADCYKAYEDLRAANPLEWKLLMSETIHPGMNGHKLFAEVIAETISGKRVKLDDVGPLPASLAFTFARLLAGKPLSVIAMPPYDQLVPEALRKIRPDAVINVTVWPTDPASLGPMEKWSKGIRAKKPDLVVVAVPATADAPSEEQFVRSYNWILNYALTYNYDAPFDGRLTWDVVAVLPSVTDAGTTAPRNALARRVVLGIDIGFIERPAGDTSPAAAILDGWVQEQSKRCTTGR